MSRIGLPREHGFWVMLGAVLSAAVARNASLPAAWTTALLVLVVAAVIGGALGRRIRRNGRWQLASTAMLAAAGAPVGLVAGEPPATVVLATVAWLAVLLSGSLVVRSVLARSRRDERAQRSAGLAAIVVAAAGASFLGAAGEQRAALAALGAAGFAVAMLWLAPTTRDLKRLGLGLGALATLTAVLLSA